MKTKQLFVLAQKFQQLTNSQEKNQYGGCEFVLPDTHQAGLIVPKGGSNCGNCKFGEMREDGPHCNNEHWIAWNCGESRLPVDDPTTYCSDWWISAE